MINMIYTTIIFIYNILLLFFTYLFLIISHFFDIFSSNNIKLYYFKFVGNKINNEIIIRFIIEKQK